MTGVGPRSLGHLDRTQDALPKQCSAEYTFEGIANVSLCVIDTQANFPVIAITYVRFRDPDVSCDPVGVGARRHGVTEAVLYVLKAQVDWHFRLLLGQGLPALETVRQH